MSKLVYTHPNTKALMRFFRRVVVRADSGCWEWQGALTAFGHGSFGWNYFSTSAHRVSYSWFVAKPSPEQVVDHLCRNPRCVNPAHLEAVSQSVNVRRGLGSELRTHCTRGHAMVEGNIFLQRNYGVDMRTCAKCRRIREDRRRNKRRLIALASLSDQIDVVTEIRIKRSA